MEQDKYTVEYCMDFFQKKGRGVVLDNGEVIGFEEKKNA